MSGKLYIVPTPIGNLDDITLRAIQILKQADTILAEDTRTSSVLLKHHGIQTNMIAHHKFNEHKSLKKIIELLQAGKTIALISDAGTPGISDPGFLIVRECIQHNIGVETLAGATAFVPALINSGLPAHEFLFIGFLPIKKGRETKLKEIATEKRTIILYESPYRIVKTLQQLLEFTGDRKISVSRELSKKFEETVRGNISEVILHFTIKAPKGEFVIVLEGLH
ncbi:MAG: 16S rRNA (cytidine(1402)-2'-O)-methyltransferase [Bacteroidetes bacterium]|nr:16S rRNA (cytidine(1402)-2'-O)-methyltransferase [Bacteroidota bacterium]MBP7399462.1 16S rRNA (cytidine(1402)-2'-O)-methyltransferase [Chitinophagales bacterium]MBK8486712.1 16S rRNA (cytidine(1402)-2'-O)-methyltransferase [Bacteroidota bacterium]MBP8754145.1 16S rRNA (cytidine(1402)-2'-O)-methyltransferase [Chitinophagales bacterium]MBP9188900.1 16S rRNA (cytidine(1402)-2'-O)-methyltransferase [Chitinophagales bacterium]